MTSYEQEFLNTGQEARKLSIALDQFTQTEDQSWKKRCEKYLAVRFRPAAAALIRQGDIFRLRQLFLFASVTETALHTFIMDAVSNSQDEILAFLLEFKKEHFGFHDRTFTL